MMLKKFSEIYVLHNIGVNKPQSMKEFDSFFIYNAYLKYTCHN